MIQDEWSISVVGKRGRLVGVGRNMSLNNMDVLIKCNEE